MRILSLLLASLLVFLHSSHVHAVDTSVELVDPQPGWEEEYQEQIRISANDRTKLYSRLKEGDKWVGPAPACVAQLRRHSREIVRISKMYKVNPAAVAGSILAEFSLNARHGGAVKETLLGFREVLFGSSQVSYGWAQIQPKVALEVEPWVMTLQGRRMKRKFDDIVEVLRKDLDGESLESYHYTAAILGHNQSIYRDNLRFDLYYEVPMQATLFNTGNAIMKANRAAQDRANYKPQVNFFGLFVKHNLDLIYDIVGLEPHPSAAPYFEADRDFLNDLSFDAPAKSNKTEAR